MLSGQPSGGWLLADNPLRLTQVATGPVVLLTSLLSLFEFDVGSQVQPFQTAARTAHLASALHRHTKTRAPGCRHRFLTLSGIVIVLPRCPLRMGASWPPSR